jgi:hypothetical protein
MYKNQINILKMYNVRKERRRERRGKRGERRRGGGIPSEKSQYDIRFRAMRRADYRDRHPCADTSEILEGFSHSLLFCSVSKYKI